MDRRGRGPAAPLIRLALGWLAAGLSLTGLAWAGGGDPPVRAMAWAAPDADPARAFGTAPTECLKPSPDLAVAALVEVGRAAFRTPLVLGGQAARAGINCETCHRSGRSNPDFLFPGVSGPPGTADVTSSLFSSHRGNGRDDPLPIPDLSGPKSLLKVSQGPQDRMLEPFIHGLVVEEFDGPEPPPAVLAGLAAYVRALDPAGCPGQPPRPVTVASLMDDARRAARAAQGLIAAQDQRAAVVMIAGARARLGLIDERFAGASLAAERRALRLSDRRLAVIQEGLRQGSPQAGRALSDWITASNDLQATLTATSSASLFDPARLAQAAKRRLPP